MMDVSTQMSVEDAMNEILRDCYAAVSPDDYRKQVRIQIANEAAQNENFAREFEVGVSDYFSSAPRLDEIEDYVNGMDPMLEDTLERYGVLERAREFSGKQEA